MAQTNMLEVMPHELLYKILLPMAYKDIISYVRTAKFASRIYNDVRFWMEKLDLEYAQIIKGNEDLKPSKYIRMYNHPDDGVYTYVRWLYVGFRTHHDLDTAIIKGHNDQIIWHIESKNITNFHKYSKPLMLTAARSGNVQILNWLTTQGYMPTAEITTLATEHDQLGVIMWMEMIGHKVDAYIADQAWEYNSVQILTWLATERNIVPHLWYTKNISRRTKHISHP
jgi:hypothetical protein